MTPGKTRELTFSSEILSSQDFKSQKSSLLNPVHPSRIYKLAQRDDVDLPALFLMLCRDCLSLSLGLKPELLLPRFMILWNMCGSLILWLCSFFSKEKKELSIFFPFFFSLSKLK